MGSGTVLGEAGEVGTEDLAVTGTSTSVCSLIEKVSAAGASASSDGKGRKGSTNGDNSLGGVPK